MNGKNIALVAGLAALAAASWLLLRGGHGGDAPRADQGSGTASGPVASSGGSVGSTGAGGSSSGGSDDRVHAIQAPIHLGSGYAPEPAQPDSTPGRRVNLANGFDSMHRDGPWADEHAREIDRRILALHDNDVTVDPPDCRDHECRITITAADDRALGRFVGKLQQRDAGLTGYAQTMVVEQIADTSDGKRQERVYARFGD